MAKISISVSSYVDIKVGGTDIRLTTEEARELLMTLQMVLHANDTIKNDKPINEKLPYKKWPQSPVPVNPIPPYPVFPESPITPYPPTGPWIPPMKIDCSCVSSKMRSVF